MRCIGWEQAGSYWYGGDWLFHFSSEWWYSSCLASSSKPIYIKPKYSGMHEMLMKSANGYRYRSIFQIQWIVPCLCEAASKSDSIQSHGNTLNEPRFWHRTMSNSSSISLTWFAKAIFARSYSKISNRVSFWIFDAWLSVKLNVAPWCLTPWSPALRFLLLFVTSTVTSRVNHASVPNAYGACTFWIPVHDTDDIEPVS